MAGRSDKPAQPSNRDWFELNGKVAFVSGAGGHLGSAIANALAAAGATVVLQGRNTARLTSVKQAIESAGGSASVEAFDLTIEDEIDSAFDRIGDQFGSLHIVVNNAYSGSVGTLETVQAADYERAVHMAVVVPAQVVNAALPLLGCAATSDDTASVINIASMYGVVSPDPSIYRAVGHSSPPTYAAAKGGLIQWTRYMAVHLAHRNVRVNAIAPGPFPRPEVKTQLPELIERIEAKVPMGRIGEPFEVAGVAVFLASKASSFVTGANIPVDGGWTAW